ncbi:hypothetical protein FGIG_07414 [Fasciola gigantica]|uniref:Uncharacterized protein n=1 Tax=Fasciola gigantica TaxID=46835 RepID=A0A504YJK3_FASGI|nr:hypothetical protein FGIG_07414 [Fasciola gigantica]
MQHDRGESILSKLSSPSSSAIRRGPKNIDLHPVTNTTYTEVFTSPVKVSRKSTVEQNSWPIFHGPHSDLISDSLKTIPFAKTQNQPVNQLLMTATFWNNLSLCIRQQQEQQHHQHEQHQPYQLQPTEKITQKLPRLNYTVCSFDGAESINPSPEDKGFGLKLGRLGDKRTRYIDESLAITGSTLDIKSTAVTTPSSTQPMTVQATSTDLQENLVKEAQVFTSPVKVSRKSTVEQNSWPIFHGPHSDLISDSLKTIPFAKTQNQPVNQLLMTATFWNNLSLCIRQQQEQQHHQHEQHQPYQLQPTEKIHQKLPHLNYTVCSFDGAESINPSPEDKGLV